MRETIEFRIPEHYAAQWLQPDEGETLGRVVLVRKYEVETNDARLNVVKEAHREFQRRGLSFYTAWKINRRYSDDELARSSLIRVKVTSVFEPCGEDCGTQYDESSACQLCGAGATQMTDLSLNVKAIPGNIDIAKTIAGEVVVSARVFKLFTLHDISGVRLVRVNQLPQMPGSSTQWFQVFSEQNDLEMVPPTKAGSGPFNENSGQLSGCSAGDLLGLSLLSEVTVRYPTPSRYDVGASRQFIGCRRGVIRPERVLVISQKAFRVLREGNVRGFEPEVVHTDM